MSMTRLLVSVPNLAEAQLAAELSADIIDLKDPGRGALGAVSLATVREVAAALPGTPISATCGDLDAGQVDALAQRIAALDRVFQGQAMRTVKIGLFGSAGTWGQLLDVLGVPTGCDKVAMVFADEHRQPPTAAMLQRLCKTGAVGIMVDTRDKRGPGLTGCWTGEQIQRFVATVREAGAQVGLAGKLTLADVEMLLPLVPDVIGVRSAVCARADRAAALDADALTRLRATLRAKGHFERDVFTPRPAASA